LNEKIVASPLTQIESPVIERFKAVHHAPFLRGEYHESAVPAELAISFASLSSVNHFSAATAPTFIEDIRPIHTAGS
jgi:hypothetical protein